jgi:hypothetical protein
MSFSDAADLNAIVGAGEPSGPDGRESNKLVHAGSSYPDVRRRTPPGRSARIILSTEQSALARDRLLAELDVLRSGDEAANWAHSKACRQKMHSQLPMPSLSKPASRRN